MACSEPQVEGKVRFPIITLEVTVMQLMEKRSSRNYYVSLDDEHLESDVALCWGESCMLSVHQHVNGVRGDNPVNKDAAEINNMLNRMHGQSGPRADIDVFMMEKVRGFVERRPMQ